MLIVAKSGLILSPEHASEVSRASPGQERYSGGTVRLIDSSER
jgi:hypothetical protein